jgi:hypothetical protein
MASSTGDHIRGQPTAGYQPERPRRCRRNNPPAKYPIWDLDNPREAALDRSFSWLVATASRYSWEGPPSTDQECDNPFPLPGQPERGLPTHELPASDGTCWIQGVES